MTRLGRMFLWGMTFLTALFPCSACFAEGPSTLVIVGLGDSITKGVRSGVDAEQTFCALVQDGLAKGSPSTQVINLGIGGERTDQALRRFEQVLEKQPGIVLVMYGTNDSYVDMGRTTSRITVDEYRKNLQEIAAKLIAAKSQPVLMTPPRWSADAAPSGSGENPNVALEPYVVACREVAREGKLSLVDHYARWTEAERQGTNLRDWTTDGCHPNPAGHREMATAILAVLQTPTPNATQAATRKATQDPQPAPARGARRQPAAAPPLPPTHADVPYGPDPSNVLDFWKAEGEGPRPLLVHIHGGGWVGGDKKQSAAVVKPFLDKGISYASINYRHTDKAPLPAPVHDAARAIQFLRSKAAEWNIRKDRFALTGGSAGACTSMWLLCHEDLADPQAEDAVLRESTRVSAAAVSGGQTSIDPKVIEPWLGPKVLEHRMINMAVGETTMAGALENYERHKALYVEFSPYNHMSAGDPPLFMTYGGNMTLPSENAGHGIHHPVYGVKMKEKGDAAGVECHLVIPGVSNSEKYGTPAEFLFDKLLAP